MKTTKKILMVCCLMVLAATGYAQQWEIDYANGDSLIQFNHGILDSEGNCILVGGCGPAYPDYHPIVMRVEPDGTHFEREYDGFDGLMLNHVVQLQNGNYFAAGLISEEAVEVLVLDSNLEIMEDKRYEKPEDALLLTEGRLLLDDDGTVVMTGGARYPAIYGSYFTRPYLYRFDENADTLRCRYVMAEMPNPEYYLHQFECHQILKNPQNDGLVLMGRGRNGLPSLICYDYDFNYIDNIWMENDHMLLFTSYSSCCWLSDDDLLVFGTLRPYNEQSRTIGLLDVKLSGGVPRLDTIHAEPELPYRVASGKFNSATFINDTTIYCSYYSSENLYGPYFPSVCLLDKDMEILGNKVFLDEEYTNHPVYFTLPQNDGGCIIVTSYALSNNTIQGKLIKMRREDFNPIPCSVEELPQETVKVYPNPAKDRVTIDGTEAAEVQVYNALGQIVRTVQGTNEIDLRGLAEGVYLLRITDADGKSHAARVVVE